jgi:cathepsin D
MHFSFATIVAIVPLLASATPLAQSPRVTIPISKRSNLRRHDGSVDVEALKSAVVASTTYFISFLIDYFMISHLP